MIGRVLVGVGISFVAGAVVALRNADLIDELLRDDPQPDQHLYDGGPPPFDE